MLMAWISAIHVGGGDRRIDDGYQGFSDEVVNLVNRRRRQEDKQFLGWAWTLTTIIGRASAGGCSSTSLGNHPKPAIDNHFKTGHREAA
jgi:hypothetical protein